MTGDDAQHQVIETCIHWLDQGHEVELITVARTWGSAPRPMGSLAAVRDDGLMMGSVSGGCVEKQLAERVRDARAHGTARSEALQVSDQDARQFGLSCGGELELVFERLQGSEDADSLRLISSALNRRERTVRRVTLGSSESPRVEPAGPDDSVHWDGKKLTQVFGPQWRVLLIGAGQLSHFTALFAQTLEFQVVVCDPRDHFRKSWQLSGCTVLDVLPDEAVQQYGLDSNAAVLALTHDPSLDDLALGEAIEGEAFYIGALGSRRSHDKRLERLHRQGHPAAATARIYGPVGLAIGSRSSAEIGMAIAAQLVEQRARMAPAS